MNDMTIGSYGAVTSIHSIVPSKYERDRLLPVPVLVVPKRYGRYKIHPQDLIDAAAHVGLAHGVTDLVPKSASQRGRALRRTNIAVLIRWALISLLFEHCKGIPTVRVGELIGRDHSTVVHARQCLTLNPSMVEKYREMIMEAMSCAVVKD